MRRLILLMCLIVASGASARETFDPRNPNDLKKLLHERGKFVELDQRLAKTFLGYESIRHATYVARLIKGNMLLFGLSGAAKSKFVQRMLDEEGAQYFKVTLYSMMTEHAIVGAQGLDSLKTGEFAINFKGTLGNYRLALIDELDKGNTALLESLLSLLEERKIWAGGELFHAKTETIFSTSNKNLVEFYASFKRRGEEGTADALLDRLHIKAFANNWLKKEQQKIIDDSHFAWFSTESVHNEESSKEPIDWEFLRLAAKSLLKLDDAFRDDFQDFVIGFRGQLPKKSPSYVPTAQLSERVRQKIPSIILYSAFVDFLLSPMSETRSKLQSSFDSKLLIDHSSLWRSYLALTTVTPGTTKLKLNEKTKMLDQVEFSDALRTIGARDDRETQMFENFQKEQNIFSDEFTDIVEKARKRNLGNAKDGIGILSEGRSIESQLLDATE